MTEANKITPTCTQCQHYYISWDKNFPYACRVLGFKSYRQPYLEVLESSGQDCLAFQPKNKPAQT